MNYDIFRAEISSIFATTGRPAPTGAVLNAIWLRVETLPDEFMPWAASKMRDMEKIPANIGAHLANTLWPDWRRHNPQKVEREFTTCPDCNGPFDHAGYGFYAWLADDTGATYCYFVPCQCAPANMQLYSRTKMQIIHDGGVVIPPEWDRTMQEFDWDLRHGKQLGDII